MAKQAKSKWSKHSQLIVPLLSIALIILFNAFRDPSFFSIEITTNNAGSTVLTGNLISILNGASELAILAMGMTLVTAACGGQDISVGALAAIAGVIAVSRLSLGHHWRTLFGTLTTIKAIVTTSGLRDPWWQSITTGAMLCFFILLQSVVLSNRGKGGLKRMLPQWMKIEKKD